MTVTQTVEIPADRRLIINVPREVPTGRVVLTFTKAKSAEPGTTVDKWVNPLFGLAKAKGAKLTVERFLETQRAEIEIENDRQFSGKCRSLRAAKGF